MIEGMGDYSCSNYNRQGGGFRIQSIPVVAINMQDNTSSSAGEGCAVPQSRNILTLSSTELLSIRQTLSACPILPQNLSSIDASTQLSILQMKRSNNTSIFIRSKGLTGDQGLPVGAPIEKDMTVGGSDALIPQDAPFGVAIPSGQTSCYWSDWGDDIFDGWGFFYIFDVATQEYFFPIFNPMNLDDGVFDTQEFTAFGRIYTITSGYPAQGIFKFDVSCSDSSEFIFGAFGEVGSDDSTNNTNLTQAYTLDGTNYTLFYNFNVDGTDETERLYSYFVPYEPELNNTKTYSDFVNTEQDGDLSLFSVPLRYGITVYFSKTTDVKDWVINDLTL